MVREASIPAALKAEEQWVCWRDESRNGSSTKVPVAPDTGEFARVDDPDTWTRFGTAWRHYEDNAAVDGVGFVFHEDGPFVGVDIDTCRDPDRAMLDERVLSILLRLDSYTEASPSGEGLHVILTGKLPDNGNRSGNVEFYDRVRFFTVTGDHLPGTPAAVEHRNRQLRAVHADLFATDDETDVSGREVTRPIDLTDDELLERARQAANGDKFGRLWNGDTSGYPSHIEADLALCTMLAFWTGGDPRRIEQLFERSGLVRHKWRERPDYRRRTVRRAVRSCNAFYEPTAEDEA